MEKYTLLRTMKLYKLHYFLVLSYVVIMEHRYICEWNSKTRSICKEQRPQLLPHFLVTRVAFYARWGVQNDLLSL
jgi:hypothetical protein